MAAKTGTYTLIASTTLSTSTSTVTFSSIPATYTDLVLVIAGEGTGAGNYAFQFNSDTGTNYSDTALYGDGTSAASNRRSGQAYGYFGIVYASQGTTVAHIMDYANTNTYKTAIARSNNAGNRVESRVTMWRSTAAINRIDIVQGTFASGSTFKLYGIEAGNL